MLVKVKGGAVSFYYFVIEHFDNISECKYSQTYPKDRLYIQTTC